MVNSPPAKVGTGVFLPVYDKDNSDRHVFPSRSSSKSPPRRNSSKSNGLGPNPSPAAVALHQQLIKQQAMKAAAAASPFGAFSSTAAGFMDPPGLYQPMQLPSTCALDSNGSFATVSSADSFPFSPCSSDSCALSPAALSPLPSSCAVGQAALAVPQQQFYPIVGACSADLQDLALLQQQEAAVDAALLNLISLRQQLAAMPTSATVPAQQQALFAVSAEPLWLAPPQAVSAPVSPCTAAAQLQLASLQAQQQQLVSVEAQLQAELAEQMVRMLGL